jgi:hypothetical protein
MSGSPNESSKSWKDGKMNVKDSEKWDRTGKSQKKGQIGRGIKETKYPTYLCKPLPKSFQPQIFVD